jgi:hypothetical protein
VPVEFDTYFVFEWDSHYFDAIHFGPLTTAGQTFVHSRDTVSQFQFQNSNRVLSNGMAADPIDGPHTFAFGSRFGINGGGGASTLLKSELFIDGTFNGMTVDSSFTPSNGIDMEGYHWTRLELTLDSFASPAGQWDHDFNYTFRVYGEAGQVPEPRVCVLIVIAGLFYVNHRYRTPYAVLK